MLLVSGLGVEVEFSDLHLKLLTLSVDVLQVVLWEEFLVVELSDLLLLVESEAFIRIPRLAMDLLKESPLLLARSWFRKRGPLAEEEWHRKELLPIRRVELLVATVLIHSNSVVLQVLVNLLNKLLIRLGGCWLLVIVHCIHKPLNLDWIAFAGCKLLL